MLTARQTDQAWVEMDRERKLAAANRLRFGDDPMPPVIIQDERGFWRLNPDFEYWWARHPEICIRTIAKPESLHV
jgi:hypothetical protein